MTLPSDIGSALSMLNELVRDPNLALGMQTVGLILLVGYVITWAFLKVAK